MRTVQANRPRTDFAKDIVAYDILQARNKLILFFYFFFITIYLFVNFLFVLDGDGDNDDNDDCCCCRFCSFLFSLKTNCFSLRPQELTLRGEDVAVCF